MRICLRVDYSIRVAIKKSHVDKLLEPRTVDCLCLALLLSRGAYSVVSPLPLFDTARSLSRGVREGEKEVGWRERLMDVAWKVLRGSALRLRVRAHKRSDSLRMYRTKR